MRMKEMCERFKRFLFPSPVLEDDEVKKCKYCGEVIANTEKEFCSEYCEEFYWRDEYYKKKYGITKCVVCGKEFIKRDSYDDTCSEVCRYKKQILDLENRIKEQGETNINDYVVTPEAFNSAVDAEIENAKKMDVKKCKYCGKELEDTNKDFCDNYCEHRYLWNEYCKKKYGVSNCVICGKEFVKQTAMDVTCSYSCDLKNRILNLEKENVSPETALEINNNDCDVVPEVKKCKYCGKVLDDSQKEFCSILCKGLYLATKPCKDETQGVNTRQCVCMSDVEQSRAAQEDNSESVELEENLLPEIENDNCTAQCDCVLKDTRSEEMQEAKQLQTEINHLFTEQGKLRVEIDNFGKRFADFGNKVKCGEQDFDASAKLKQFQSEISHLQTKNKKLQVEFDNYKKHFADFQSKFPYGGRKGYDRLMAETVKFSRDNGETWKDLAKRLGISTVTARKLYKFE